MQDGCSPGLPVRSLCRPAEHRQPPTGLWRHRPRCLVWLHVPCTIHWAATSLSGTFAAARTAAAGNAVAECSFASAASPAGALLPARPHNRQPRRLWAYRGCRGERPPDDAEELTSEPRCRHDLRASPRSLAERWPNRGPGESPGTQPSPHTSACGARAADSRVLRGFRSSTVCCGRAVPDSSAVPSGCWTLLHEQRGPAHAKHQLGELRPGGPGGAAPAWLPS
mmetsp:Transcript_137570/g.343292  ORF Transcript_137570/g.343292 Transcript_137570/m.343292 type:complete len:224 (+) Transcript_137570:846-1517(+)